MSDPSHTLHDTISTPYTAVTELRLNQKQRLWSSHIGRRAICTPGCHVNYVPHSMPFLRLALDTIATIYLPKVSSHSTSSSIVRSKSSNEGLPSGFFKKSERSCEFQNPFSRKLSRLQSWGTPRRQDSGVGETGWPVCPTYPVAARLFFYPMLPCPCSGTY